MNIVSFADLERAVDDYIERNLADKPLFALLTGLYFSIYLLNTSAPIVDGHEPDREAAATLISNLGNLLPLLRKCPIDPHDGNASEALDLWAAIPREAQAALLGYTHFCQIAPYVHRGAYVFTNEDRRYTLRHPTPGHAENDRRDIILSYLYQPANFSCPPMFNAWFDRYALNRNAMPLDEADAIGAEFFLWFYRTISRNSMLSEDAIQAAIGVSTDAYTRFVAACLALCHFHEEIVGAISRKLGADKTVDSPELKNILLDSIARIRDTVGLQATLKSVGGLTDVELERLFSVYACAFPHAHQAGDGYLPPFSLLGNDVLFCPYVVQSMLGPRNILYSVHRQDLKRFDNLVAQHLEPHLVDHAARSFSSLEDVDIVKNIKWRHGEVAGEFDLLVYCGHENTLLTVQAKATITPDGARMVERTEGRMMEGLDQLDRFLALPQIEQDRIISAALQKNVKEVVVVKVLLGWAGFGGHRIWERLNDVAPLNIALLEALTHGTSVKLHDLVSLAHAKIDEIVNLSEARWEDETLELGAVSITVPLLKFRTAALLPYIWR